jgi:hypothetical protein
VRQCKKPTIGQAHLVFADTHSQTLKNQKSLPLPTAHKQNDDLNTHLVRYLIFMLSFANYKQVQE